MTPLEIEESKLTGNVDTFACWNNHLHKELKLKYYAEDLDERIENEVDTKTIIGDYINRNNPPKYPVNQNIAEMIKEEELQHKLELRDKAKNPEKYMKVENIQQLKNDVKNDVIESLNKDINVQPIKEIIDDIVYNVVETKDLTPLQKLNNLKVEQAIKENEENKQMLKSDKIGVKDKNIGVVGPQYKSEEYEEETKDDDEVNDDEYTKQLKNIMSDEDTLTYDSSMFSTSDIPQEDDNVEMINKKLIDISKAAGKKEKYNIILKNPGKTGDIILSRDGNNTVIYYYKARDKDTKTAKKGSVYKATHTIKKNGNKFTEPKLMNEVFSLLQAGLMTAEGIKSKSKRSKKPTRKDIEHYKSRFLILKGQILSGNDNPVVVNELKTVIKILDANKLLNKS